MVQTGNADETPIWFDMPCNYTIAKKGTKEVFIKTSGCGKQHVTVMLAITSEGRKLPPYLIFKWKMNPKIPKSEKMFPDDVIVHNQEKGWMTEILMFDWLRNVWEIHLGGL
jgi:DDE superfamily endonuclease.